MLPSWKRLYVLGTIGVVALGVDSCLDRGEELPQSLLPNAQAQESAAAADRTVAQELRFEIDSPTLLREDEAALEDFLRRTEAAGRVQALKVMVWAPLDSGGRPAKGLAKQRLDALRTLIERAGTPAQYFLFSEERDASAERSQAAVLAVLE